MSTKAFPAPSTRSQIIAKIGFEPAVSDTVACFSALVPDAQPGETITIDADRFVISRTREAASDNTSGYNSTSKAGVPVKLNSAILYCPFGGQSLAGYLGTYTPALITSTALYPSHTIIPSVGAYLYGKTWSTVKDAVDEYYDSSITSQGSTAAGASYAVPVAFINRLYEKITADTDIDPIILGLTDARGSTSISGLGPGSDPGEWAVANMEQAKAYAVSQGRDIVMLFEVFIHGDSDEASMSRQQYKSWLIGRQRWRTALARRIFGQTEEVVLYIEQLAGGRTALGDVSDVVQAQIELCRELPHLFRFLPPAHDLVHEDGTHLNSANYHIRDLRHAETVYSDFFCGGQAPLCVTDAWWTGTTTIRCRVEAKNHPLVIDYADNSSTVTFDAGTDVVTIASFSAPVDGTMVQFSNSGGGLPPELTATGCYYTRDASGSTCKLAATSGGAAIDLSTAGTGTHTVKINGDGIRFDDGSGSPPYVTGISVADDGVSSPAGRAFVDVTLSGTAASTGRKRLMFGMQSGPAGTSSQPGNVGGARSSLRDSAVGTSAVNRSGSASTYNLYNWLASQEVIIT